MRACLEAHVGSISDRISCQSTTGKQPKWFYCANHTSCMKIDIYNKISACFLQPPGVYHSEIPNNLHNPNVHVPGTLFARPRMVDVPWVYQPHSSCCHRDFPPQPTVLRLGRQQKTQKIQLNTFLKPKDSILRAQRLVISFLLNKKNTLHL